MSHSRTRQALAAVLIICILVVGGLASAGSVTHESHHAHHQKATHGTVLCTWMCAAGTVLDSAAVPVQAEISPVGLLPLPQTATPSSGVLRTSSSRAPPSFSL